MHIVSETNRSLVNPALQLASTRALVLTGGSGAAIALTQQGAMVCRASVGNVAPGLGCQLDVTSGFSGECVRTGQVLRCDDSETDPRVDIASCRKLGIRSILAAPIQAAGEVVGLLEVFSTQPFAFDDSHVVVVDRLARSAIQPVVTPKTTPPPHLLVEREPGYRVFSRNLVDILFPPVSTELDLSSEPGRFWDDVFVSSRLPWDRFLQSIVVHVVMILAIGGVLEFWLSRRPPIQRLTFNKSDVIYYSPSEYLQALEARKATPRVIRKGQPTPVRQTAIKVPREQARLTQAKATPPTVTLKHELRLLHLVALNSIAPAVPLSATNRTHLRMPGDLAAAVAPPPDSHTLSGTRTMDGVKSGAVVPPPPEVSAPSRLRAPVVLQTAVIGPAPDVSSASGSRVSMSDVTGVVAPPPPMPQLVREINGVNVGYVEVVAPAPQLAAQARGVHSAMVQAGLRDAVTSVVPPPPSLSGTAGTGNGHRSASALAVQAALAPAAARGSQEQGRGGSGLEEPSRIPVSPLPPADAINNEQQSVGETKEMNVNLIGLALALPSSSYFSSHEVYLAEDRPSRHHSRLIKLVYEYLPYQRRLSEFGPDYPTLDNLRVTRDPACDETLGQMLSSANAPGWPQADRMRDLPEDRQARLECYRTTADDYRRARAHHR